ncbi:uncharacterized protein DUF4233 [Prauserella shujinwangii]|uniref:Uncharacterized protein DUF4233 n=1 Tax=Prauserella shujinwangii TaxID=1453103 RepID=A0A2T0LUA3_9PSEU|nr:DUF4233 domain-containing protein [Prauserella shujinwangii]PRX47274.1 uncharacterized protein DUF4233 [Prauserella shujinwangii]
MSNDKPGTGTSAPRRKDPLTSFRGVQAGTLVIEAIVVALALPVVAQLGDGITSLQGWLVMGIAVALVGCCGLLRRPWAMGVVYALHAALIAFLFWLPSVGVVGLLFLAVWLWLMWLRRKVAIRMAEGTLPGQQEHTP